MLISIIGTLNVVMLGWLSVEVRSVKKDLKGKVDEQSLEECKINCHREYGSIWKRVNSHAHTHPNGKVVITED